MLKNHKESLWPQMVQREENTRLIISMIHHVHNSLQNLNRQYIHLSLVSSYLILDLSFVEGDGDGVISLQESKEFEMEVL